MVGSRALKLNRIPFRESSDTDYWVSDDYDYEKTKGLDFKVIPIEILSKIPHNKGIATTDAIYTIKCSHLGWDNPMWDKHKADVLYLKSIGCTLLPELYSLLVNHWKKELGNKEFLNLDNSKEKFFTDYVNYKYDHDTLHLDVSYPNDPMYTKCLKDGYEVLIDREKFDKMSLSEQVRMFREEISVIALERWLLNDYWCGRISWIKAYQLALRKTITNLTKNWATDFIVLNLERFYKPDFSYFKYTLEKYKGECMSKVDMKVFEELLEVTGYRNMSELVLALADGEMVFAGEYEFENEYPTYSLSKSDPEAYGAQRHLYFKERDEVYQPLEQSMKDEWDYEHLMQEGGGDGGSEHCEGVFKLKGKIYKCHWSYYSYNGYEYDYIESTLREVTPKEKVVTVYE